MKSSWSIDGEDLNDRPRMGGVHALAGFAFQEAYALLRLTWLLTQHRGLVELRYEGAQDVDLRYGDRREVLTQAKDYEPENLTSGVLHDVLAGFTRDLISASARAEQTFPLPKFRLVCTNPPDEPKALELFRGVWKEEHAATVASKVKPEYRKGYNDAEVLGFALEAISRTTYEVVGNDDVLVALQSQASWNLARFGVPVDHVATSLAQLEKALKPRETFLLSDVVRLLTGLPEGHPGRDDSPCRILPSRRELVLTADLKTQFLHGSAQTLWCAVANDLDVQRDEAGVITKKLEQLIATGGMLLLEGAGGSGKSTLARRVAWDAHLSGAFLVFHVPFPGDFEDSSWRAVLHLVKLADKPVLLVVDDVWRRQNFVAALDRRIRTNLCVLATARPGGNPATEPDRLLIQRVSMGKLSHDIVEALRILVSEDAQAGTQITDGVIQRFLASGQMLALSLTLQRGSLNGFAKSILEPLQDKGASYDAFLDLCAAGAYDHSVPFSFFDRATPVDSRFWTDKNFEGLVYLQAGKTSRRLRVGHALVAEAIASVANVDTVARVIRFCEKCDRTDMQERRFVIRLLVSVAEDSTLRGQVRGNQRFVTAIESLLDSSSFADVHRLVLVLDLIGEHERAARVLLAATVDRIRDDVDVGMALSRSSAREEFIALFPVLFDYFGVHANAQGRRRFLQRVRHFGTPDQQRLTVEQIGNWLTAQQFPSEETSALFDLATYAPDYSIVQQTVPLISLFLETKEDAADELGAAVRLARRSNDMEVARILVLRVIGFLETADVWSRSDFVLAQQMARLIHGNLVEALGARSSDLLIRMFEQANEWRRKRSLLRAVIGISPVSSLAKVKEAVDSMIRQYPDRDTSQLKAHFNRVFGLADSTTV